jgi:hypothetical protein
VQHCLVGSEMCIRDRGKAFPGGEDHGAEGLRLGFHV